MSNDTTNKRRPDKIFAEIERYLEAGTPERYRKGQPDAAFKSSFQLGMLMQMIAFHLSGYGHEITAILKAIDDSK